MSRTRSLALVFTLCLASAARVHAQECGPNQVVPWWPHAQDTGGAESLNASERRAIETQLTAVEALRTPTLFGATATFGRFHEEVSYGFFVLFTAGGQSPTLPVTREEYLRAMIFTLEGKNQEKVKASAAIVSKTPYERWMAEAPDRKKRNEEIYAIVATTNPAQAAKMRADMEHAEQAETEKLKRADAYERAQVSRNLAGLTILGDKYRAQIAAMTPQERASAAFLVGDDLVPAGTPNAYAIVRKNPAFYRAGASPVQPRAIIVKMPNAYPEYLAQQAELYKQLDWAAIKRMVN